MIPSVPCYTMSIRILKIVNQDQLSNLRNLLHYTGTIFKKYILRMAYQRDSELQNHMTSSQYKLNLMII